MIIGKKVRLRAIEREDLPTFVRWFNDQEVTRYLQMSGPLSLAQEERWFQSKLEDEKNTVLAIETLDGVHIGNLGLHNVDYRNRHAQLGIVIGEKEYWNQGYGTDAVRTALYYAFDELNLNRVFLRVYAYNQRAIRCYEKCGFRHEGTLRQDFFRNGEYHDTLIMGILRQEFNEEEADRS